MDLIWNNANNWSYVKLDADCIVPTIAEDGTCLEIHTIFLVHFLYGESELTFTDYLMIILMPSADGRIFRTREFGKWMEVKTIHDQAEQVCQP